MDDKQAEREMSFPMNNFNFVHHPSFPSLINLDKVDAITHEYQCICFWNNRHMDHDYSWDFDSQEECDKTFNALVKLTSQNLFLDDK